VRLSGAGGAAAFFSGGRPSYLTNSTMSAPSGKGRRFCSTRIMVFSTPPRRVSAVSRSPVSSE
jgi:hypothetical protein